MTKRLRPSPAVTQRASPPWRCAISRTNARPNPIPTPSRLLLLAIERFEYLFELRFPPDLDRRPTLSERRCHRCESHGLVWAGRRGAWRFPTGCARDGVTGGNCRAGSRACPPGARHRSGCIPRQRVPGGRSPPSVSISLTTLSLLASRISSTSQSSIGDVLFESRLAPRVSRAFQQFHGQPDPGQRSAQLV